MAGIIPKTTAGALAANSALVENAATPAAPFQFDCDYLGLPSNCTARILPSQINAIVSEMVNLAACFDPDGTWQCANLNNLCTAFTNYRTATAGDNTLWQDIQTLVCGMTEVATDDDSRFLYCDGNGAIHKAPGAPVALCADIVAAICGSDPCRQTLAACLISPDEDDQGILISATSGLLYQRSHQIIATQTFPATDRDLKLQTPNPIFDTGTLFIPNTSDVIITVFIEIRFTVDLIQEIINAAATVSFSMFNGAGGTGGVLMDTAIGRPNIGGSVASNQHLQIAYPPIRPFRIPPGGANAHFGFQGGADPNNGYRIRDAQGRVTVWGIATTVEDVAAASRPLLTNP